MNWKKNPFSLVNSGVLVWGALLASACTAGDPPPNQSSALPYYAEASFTPYWIDSKKFSADTFHQIPPFRLINQEGDTISEVTFAGKIYVTDFFFTTCPGICPKMTTQMQRIQEAFAQDENVLLLSHSVTPEQDSVSVLKAYATAKNIDVSKWHLATGDRDEIYSLGRTAYFVEEDLGLEKGPEEFLHTENFVLIDPNRHIRGIYNGLNTTSVNQLIADIRTLQETL